MSHRRATVSRPSSWPRRGALAAGASLLAVCLAARPGATDMPGDAALDEARRMIATGRYDDAAERARRTLQTVEQASGPDSVAAADVLDVLVEARWRGGRSRDPEVRSLADRAVSIRERLQGPGHPALARSLYGLGVVLKNTADYAGAKPIYRRALEIWERSEGPEHPDVAKGLYGLGVLLGATGDAAAAEPLFERALAIREKALGPDHPEVGRSLNALAANHRQRGDFAGARPLYERALEIWEKSEGPEHPEVAAVLNNLANVNTEMGDYAAARPLFLRAMAILEKSGGPDNPALGAVLHSLSLTLVELGDYAAARPLRDRALRIDEKALGPDHPDVADDLAGLADLLFQTGDYSGAEALYRRSLSISETALGPDHVSAAKSAEGLADVLRETGRFEEAAVLYRRVLDIWEKKVGADHAYVAKILEHMASLRRDQGDLAGARALLERAVTHWEATVGPGHPLAAIYRTELATLLLQQGDLARARPLIEDALPRLERGLGPRSDVVGWALAELARLQWHAGEASAALDGSLRACAILRERFQLTARSLSERQALRYLKTHPPDLDVALTVLAAGGTGETSDARATWDELIRSRALVLDEMAARHRAVAGGSDPAAIRLAGELEQSSRRLAHLALEGPDESDPERFEVEFRKQLEQKERAERLLASRSRAFRGSLARGRVTLADVVRALPARSALVAYVLYDRIDRAPTSRPEPSYLAFAASSGTSRPIVVPMGDAATLDALVNLWRLAVGGDPRDRAVDRTASAGIGTLLRKAIWDPVVGKLGAPAHVFVVPDGSLNLVNLAALPTENGRYLVESGPLIHYVSAERDLARGEDRVPAGASPAAGVLAIGGPDFDAAAASSRVARADPAAVAASPSPATTTVYRGPESACADFRSLRFGPLPGARGEVEEIESMFAARSIGGASSRVLALTGAQAEESRFKTDAPGRSLLHLATHAFFVNDHCPAPSSGARGRARSDEPAGSLLGENPLLLSGLALAGANRRSDPGLDAGAEDGILTAEEIAALDLSGTDWVVLSACGTGLGEIQAGEGVLGLRRAFEIAGAGTLIMTLWPVEDAATRLFMRELYRGRLEGLGAAEAVRQAGRSMIQTGRRRGDAHPYFWGAFVAAGDGR